MEQIFIGIDVGTSGTKAVAVDGAGRVLAKASESYALHQPRPGWAEQSAEDWWQATCASVRTLLGSGDVAPEAVAGVGLSGQMHGSVFLDSQGEVIRPPILWCDVRTAAQCRTIEARVGGRAALIDATANPALEGFTAPKVVWLMEYEPHHFERLAHLLLPKDYIRYRLTGEIATDVSDAAGTLLFDVARRTWSLQVARALGIPVDVLPPVLESSDIAGRVGAAAAEATGLRQGTPIVAGGADNTCGAVGSGIVADGRFLSSIGSSGVLVGHTDRVVKDPVGRVHTMNHSVPERWYVMGVTLAAGLSLRWVRDQLGAIEQQAEAWSGVDAYDLLARQAAQSPPGARGLIFLPYLNGERTPHADATARGVFFGLSGAHRRADLVRAVMEGVVYSLRDSVEIMREMGLSVTQLRAIGGGGKSQLWRQMQADAFDAEVVTLAVDEGPAFGAALLAAVGVGAFATVPEAAERCVKLGDTTVPDARRAARYTEGYELYRSLYPALQDRFQALAKSVERWEAESL